MLRAETAQDLQIILDLIEKLREHSKGATPRLEVITLEYIDCNYAADFLTQLFSRVIIAGPGGIYPSQPTPLGGGGALGAFGGAQAGLNRGFYFLALPQLNAMLVVGPEARFEDIKREIRRIDVPNSDLVRPRAFRLTKASAQIVAQQLVTFFNARFPGLSQQKTQFRVTYDTASNTVWVQASKADMDDVEVLIKDWDTMESLAVHDVKIIRIKNAAAADMAQVLTNALSVNAVNPLTQATFPPGPVVTTAGGTSGLATTGLAGLGGVPGGGLGALGAPGLGALGGGPGGGLGALGGTGAAQNVQVQTQVATVGAGQGGGLVTHSNTLRFAYDQNGKTVEIAESGLLSDVHLVPNIRSNDIIVTAPKKTMRLIELLIDKLDVPSAAAAFIKVYTLKIADAQLTATLLRNLFTGQTAGTGGGGAVGGGPTGGTGSANATTGTRPLLTLGAGQDIAPGATLIGLQIAVDDRTNSVIVAGAQNDLETINAIINRLEAADVPDRYYDVFKLRNSAAADVATALQTFVTNSLAVLSGTGAAGTGYYSTYIQLQKNVVIIAEPVSNTLLISATPFYFMEMKRMIERIDAQPPQVVIQVLIAEVQLTNDEEFGVEWGGQSSVLFQRGLLPAATATGGVTNAATPGFIFNTTVSPNLGNSTLTSPGAVGFQGLQNLGVGLSSPTAGIGGFVFQASSQNFGLLVRALKAQGRVDVLSRPQVTVADNQTGYVQVGENYPYLSASIVSGVGTAEQSIGYNPIGVTMRVTPRVNPDGKVLMRVEPQVSGIASTTVTLTAGGPTLPAFTVETVQTTVIASSGETIVLGGLVSKQDTRMENGYPIFKDIPYLGAFFRYRSHSVLRNEVLIIMTPHIIRSEVDQARILAEESAAHTHVHPRLGPPARPRDGSDWPGDPGGAGCAHQPAGARRRLDSFVAAEWSRLFRRRAPGTADGRLRFAAGLWRPDARGRAARCALKDSTLRPKDSTLRPKDSTLRPKDSMLRRRRISRKVNMLRRRVRITRRRVNTLRRRVRTTRRRYSTTRRDSISSRWDNRYICSSRTVSRCRTPA